MVLSRLRILVWNLLGRIALAKSGKEEIYIKEENYVWECIW